MALSYNLVSSRIPELSFVAPQNFYAVAENMPGVIFNLQSLTIPPVSGGEVNLPNRLNPNRAFIPGSGVDYAPLDFTFLIDKDFDNYRSILEWLKAINHPEDFDQYNDYTTNSNISNTGDFSKTTTNLTVFGCDDANNPLVHWNFVSTFPVSLDGPQYDASLTDIQYITSTVSFRFLYFENQTYTNGALNNNKL